MTLQPAAHEVSHTPAAAAAGGSELASRPRRLAAFAIDAAILTLVTGALWGRLFASLANRLTAATSIDPRNPAARGAVGRALGHTTGPYLIELVATIVLAILYYWLLTGYWGTTIGKRSLSLWVVTASDGSPACLLRSFMRALIFVLGGEVVPLFFLADNGWLLGDRRRQALHDKVAGTLVVRRPPGVPPD
ncbi:MAG TPA: RDD family protein [Streptosporangiaceae bacterium]|nr:RDD family protein [Streptosporangiaceae bacterium]